MPKSTQLMILAVCCGIIFAAAWIFAVTNDGPGCIADGADHAIEACDD